jgi:hypothetical protein
VRVDVDAEPGELTARIGEWVPAILAKADADPEFVKAVSDALAPHGGTGEPWPWPLGHELEHEVTEAVRRRYGLLLDRLAAEPMFKPEGDALVKAAARAWITADRLHRLRDIVSSEHAALAVELFGPGVLSASQLAQLRQAGILTDADVARGRRDGLRTGLGDAHLLGAVIAADPGRGRTLTLAEARSRARRLAPTTMRDRQAAVARLRGGQQIVGLGNRVADDLTTIAIVNDDERAQRYRARVSEAVAQQAEEGFDAGELRQRIAQALEGDYARDINRIVITETHAAIQGGVAAGLLDRYGDEVDCAVVPAPGACPVCHRLYTGPDGPIVWRAGLLPPSTVNFQRKAAARVACIPPAHPHCRCELVYVPAGWRVSEEGQVLPPLKKSEVPDVDVDPVVDDHGDQHAHPFTWGRHFGDDRC